MVRPPTEADRPGGEVLLQVADGPAVADQGRFPEPAVGAGLDTDTGRAEPGSAGWRSRRNDPEAAADVLAGDWNITLVPLDVTMSNVLKESHRQELLAAGHPVPQALGEMLGHYFRFYEGEGIFGRACSAMHDPLAAALAVGGFKAAVAPAVRVAVGATFGPGRGQPSLIHI
ncbi:nucleoside hydrolase [Arthrobacter sp. KBS0703]|uniref:nucleoside hydrolase n=1 Tax=Arthrobacter sp. KBS0703 TaxID=1955698 RepID=UPI0026A2CAAD